MVDKIYVHPALASQINMLTLIADMTDGTLSRVSKYLRPYMTESGQNVSPDGISNFANRQSRLYHINNCEPFIWIHLAHMSQDITVTGWDSKRAELIKADVTGEGQSAQSMAEDMLWYYMRDGRVGILTEKQPSISSTALGAEASGERSYQILVVSKNIVYWNKFREGAFRGQLAEVVIRDEDELVGGEWRQVYRRYKTDGLSNYTVDILRTRDSSGLDLTQTTGQDVDYVNTLNGAVPFIPFTIFGSSVEDSFLHSIVENNVAHMNLGSVVSNIIYNQGFERNIIVGAKPEEIKKMGEWLVTVIDNENTKVFTLSAGNPEAGFKEKAELNNHIYRRGKFEFNQLADDTRNVQSAESKERDMASRKKLYDNTLDALVTALTRIYKIHAIFEGDSPENVAVTIGRDYGLEDSQSKANKSNNVFTQAGIVGAKDVQRQVVKTNLREIVLIPNENESETDMLARLDESIFNQVDVAPIAPIADRPSVLDAFK